MSYPRFFTLAIAWFLAVAAHASPVPQEPTETADVVEPVVKGPPADAFSDWEHHTLENGVRLWVKPWPEATVVRVTVLVPVGAREDPEGLEGLAHYVEHVLFTSIPGKTEAEFKAEVPDHGGVRNGSTSHDRTEFHVEIPPEHTAFALGWLHELLFDKVFDDDNIVNQRKPILLEGGEKMKPANVFQQVFEKLDWDWVELPKYIEREFGIEHDDDPTLGTWESLHRIEPADVVRFYDEHYGPQNLLIAVVGDVDSAEVKSLVESIYGAHPKKGKKAKWVQTATDPGRSRVRYSWSDRGDAVYRYDLKVFDPNSHDRLMLELLANMTATHLDEELRWGEEKAVYSIGVWVADFRGHHALRFSAGAALPTNWSGFRAKYTPSSSASRAATESSSPTCGIGRSTGSAQTP